MLAKREVTRTPNVKRTFTNVSFLKENNVNNVKTLKFSTRKSDQAKARYLVDKFQKVRGCEDAEGCFNYFLKCFRTLPESTIWDIYENATTNPTIKSPIKYFIGACRNQMNG